jgi:hypothetical protein
LLLAEAGHQWAVEVTSFGPVSIPVKYSSSSSAAAVQQQQSSSQRQGDEICLTPGMLQELGTHHIQQLASPLLLSTALLCADTTTALWAASLETKHTLQTTT